VIKSVVKVLGLDPSFSAALLPAVAQDGAHVTEDGTGPGEACVLSGDALIAILVSKRAFQEGHKSTGLHAHLPHYLIRT